MYKRQIQNRWKTYPSRVLIQLVESSKHLRPKFRENELMLKLAYHFNCDIRLAVYTQGIKTIEELLILLTQSEHMFHTEYERKTNSPEKKLVDL